MNAKKYIGHPSQLCGVMQFRMEGGKADGMRMLRVHNSTGLEFYVSLDRCADLPMVNFKGVNMAYIAPCGLVSPNYYDNKGTGFLKSFTGGFLTTCGLTTFGSPSVDDGEELPLHGNISHTPAEQVSYDINDDEIKITAVIRDASLFGYQLIMRREISCPVSENKITITDTVENIGCRETPFMLLYHCNMGYPLLSEASELKINSCKVEPRNDHAAEDIERWADIAAPVSDFEEQCYYHSFDEVPEVSLYNPDINKGMRMTFDTAELDCFTQWKMLGDNEYVMGLEPGNAQPDGRDVMREKGMLKFLKAGEKSSKTVNIEFYEI
ncbi:MAG: aldose 1-epimerase family protein [Clostridia bacterium]|nr:aldose 1-epimerase family protein [Clostridia bacterium]